MIMARKEAPRLAVAPCAATVLFPVRARCVCVVDARRQFAFIVGVQFKDYYAILGVPKTATQDDIRKAFRKLARQHHPDVAKDKKSAEAKFKEINEANEVLGDPEKRKRYDELGADWDRPGRQAPPQGWEHRGGFEGGGFSDFFEAFFGGGGAGMRGGAGRKRRGGFGAFQQRGNDVEFELAVTVEEALHGGRKAFSLERDGHVDTLSVNIPRGVRAGQKIRLAGQGGEGFGGGERGDLYLLIRIAPHVDYRVEGYDLIRPVPVKVWTAVLGGEVEVQTPDGAVKMKIPAGTQPGQKFRLKGRGLHSGPGTRGDLFAEAKVLLPTSLSSDERALWEKLSGRGA
jgi:curved DNA-binding protein